MIRRLVSVPVVQMMARWDSHAILTYVKDAPLITITHEYLKGTKVEPVAGKDGIIKKFDEKVSRDLKALQKDVRRHESEIERLAKDVLATAVTTYPKFIISDKYQLWHIVHDYTAEDREGWKTLCGWSYGLSIFVRKSKIPNKMNIKEHGCDRCFKIEVPLELPDSDIE